MKKYLILFKGNLHDKNWNDVVSFHTWKGINQLGYRMEDVFPLHHHFDYIVFYITEAFIAKFYEKLCMAADCNPSMSIFDDYKQNEFIRDYNAVMAEMQGSIDNI